MAHSKWAAAMLAAVILGSGSAGAQESAGSTSFSGAVSALTVGARIVVTDGAGKRTRGAITGLSAGEITVGDRTFREAEVRRIRTAGDSNLNGLLIGAGIGGAAGAIGSQGLGEYNSDGVGPMIVFGVLAGAGIGATVDHFINRPVTLFETPSARARLIPMTGARRGVLVSLTY